VLALRFGEAGRIIASIVNPRARRLTLAAGMATVAIAGTLAYALRHRIREEWLFHELEQADPDRQPPIIEELSRLESLSRRGIERLTRQARKEVEAYIPGSRLHTYPHVLVFAVKAGGAPAVRSLLASADADYLFKALDRLRWAFGENPAAVSGILPLLAADSIRIRMATLEALRIAGAGTEDSVLSLLHLLRDPDQDVRREAIRALEDSQFDRRELLRQFTALARDPAPELRVVGILLLDRLTVGDWEKPDDTARTAMLAIAAALDDPVDAVHEQASSVVWNIDPGDRTVQAAMIAALARPGGELNYELINSLAKFGQPAIAPLVTALGHRSARVRLSAVEALDRMEDDVHAVAVPALVKRLTDIEPRVREAVCAALGNLGPAARPAAAELREHLDDGFDFVRGEAAEALWRVARDGKAAAAVLRETVLSRSENVFRGSVWTLRDIGPAAWAAIPALRKLLDHRDCRRRLWGAEALGAVLPDDDVILSRLPEALACCHECRFEAARICERLGARAASFVPAAIALLSHANGKVRAYAARALGGIGAAARAALPALAEAARDRLPEVREAAETARLAIVAPAGRKD
jgi:HEAT repeat protein